MDIDRTLDNILKDFSWYRNKDQALTKLFKKMTLGDSNYKDAHQYALHVGRCLERAFKSNIEASMLDYESILRLINAPIQEGYGLIADYVKETQMALNTSYGMGVKPLVADFETERVEGIAKAIAEAETEAMKDRLMGEPILQFVQHIVDGSVQKNANLANDLGMKPQIIRTYEGQHQEHTGNGTDRHKSPVMVDCDWCLNLAGTYDYEDVKNTGNDVYKRHDGCRCSLEYTLNKGEKNNVSGKAFIRW